MRWPLKGCLLATEQWRDGYVSLARDLQLKLLQRFATQTAQDKKLMGLMEGDPDGLKTLPEGRLTVAT